MRKEIIDVYIEVFLEVGLVIDILEVSNFVFICIVKDIF